MNDLYKNYRETYLTADQLELEKPVDIALEISSLCNMRCSYCYHADQKTLPFKPQIMWPPTFKKIINDAANLGVNSVKLNWRGEPTLNPYFKVMTGKVKERAKGSTFIDRITNSNFQFDPRRDDIFEGLANQTNVKVSYDSFRKDVFEAQRNKGNHDQITNNIDKFYSWPGRDNRLVIQAIRTKLNKDEDLESELKKRWPSAELSVRDMVSGRNNSDLSSLEEKSRNINHRKSCLQAHARLIFDAHGEATMCCPDTEMLLYLGSIEHFTISDLFNSYKAQTIRKTLLNKSAFLFEPCKSCSSFESFKGFKETKDS